MQNPFGSETLDMPGLSYACAAAEITLGMVCGAEQASDGPTQLHRVLGRIDRQQLIGGTNASRLTSGTERRTAKDKDDEEEDCDA